LKIFSISHLLELSAQLPDPKQAHAASGYAAVVRLPIRDWDAVRDADHPERQFEAHDAPYVEFEIVPWKDTRGTTVPRWVLRGLVAM